MVAGKGGRGRDGGRSGARDKEQIIAQAMDLLVDLAEIDPQQFNHLPERRRDFDNETDRRGEGVDEETVPPGELFGRFAKDLQMEVGRLAWGNAQHLQVPEELLVRMRAGPNMVREAGGWWYRRTLQRGQAEAQLQELKNYVEWLCGRGAGLSILLGMANAHGRAVGALMQEVDVLCRIIKATVKRLEDGDLANGSAPIDAFVRRQSQSSQQMDAHSIAGKHAEQSAKILEHLNQQLLGLETPNAGEILAPPGSRGSLADELNSLRAQLKLFVPITAGGSHQADKYTSLMSELISDMQRVLSCLDPRNSVVERWCRLETIGSLLLVRLHSAGSWVDTSTLAAIHRDVLEAVELALDACRTHASRRSRAVGDFR